MITLSKYSVDELTVSSAIEKSKKTLESIYLPDMWNSLSLEDRDIFIGILADQLDLQYAPGSLTLAMFRLLTTFEIKRKIL